MSKDMLSLLRREVEARLTTARAAADKPFQEPGMTLFITTKAGDYYHLTECPGFQAGRHGSEQAGYTLHDILETSEADARAAGKKPCKQCVADRS
ncbi:hypothetical protein ABZU75_28295 [Streptosporangium sp. NPDC005286]|uniref:hypothetical protein n=1 Tax=Streptosporangium sp. NPDC005286 TaxID=3154463 RepID=UPI0033BE6E12